MNLYEDLLKFRKRIEKAHGDINRLNRRITRVTGNMQNAVTSQGEHLNREQINCLYWEFPEIKTLTLAKIKGTSGPKFLASEIDPKLIFKCADCGHVFTAKSREGEKTIRNHAKKQWLTCPKCSIRERKDPDPTVDLRLLIQRREELKTMPYREYLETPEWKETRKTSMKRAGYKCQVCNKGDTSLNVHHRTYERRGNEYIKDLIVLCQPCHVLFHKNGRVQ